MSINPMHRPEARLASARCGPGRQSDPAIPFMPAQVVVWDDGQGGFHEGYVGRWVFFVSMPLFIASRFGQRIESIIQSDLYFAVLDDDLAHARISFAMPTAGPAHWMTDGCSRRVAADKLCHKLVDTLELSKAFCPSRGLGKSPVHMQLVFSGTPVLPEASALYLQGRDAKHRDEFLARLLWVTVQLSLDHKRFGNILLTKAVPGLFESVGFPAGSE
jgi:hypothetical protein